MNVISRQLRAAGALGAAIVVALGAAACGSGSSSSSSVQSQAAASSQPSGSGKTVKVSEKEFSIAIAGGSNLAAGTYTFQVANDGKLTHDLTISGPGVSKETTGTIDPGSTAGVTVALEKGTYAFYCSIDGHRQLGMDVSVKVGSGGSAMGGSGGGNTSGGSSGSGGGWA
jgi:uncharacterized cupredoxin-like copper-binding protein